MKMNKFLNLKTVQYFGVIALTIFTFASCSKSDTRPGSTNGSLPPFAQVEIVHAAAGASALDVSFDNNRLGLSFFNYTDRVDYLRAIPGNRSIKIFKAAAANNAAPLITKDYTFDQGRHYTVFIVDTAAKMDIVSIKDSSRSAGPDSVRLRFANMSPDAPALDLYVQGNPTPIATNISYKTAGEFFSFKSGINIVFELKKTGQSTVIATSEPTNLISSRIYTIWSGGYINGNSVIGTNLKVSDFTHNPLYY